MIKNAEAKKKILKVNRLDKDFCTDRITLFVQFFLSSRIKSISKIKQSGLLRYFSKILKIISLVSGSFPCSSFTCLPIVDRLCSSKR